MLKSTLSVLCLSLCLGLSVAVAGAHAEDGVKLNIQDNGLARTPPMGWNSWNRFGCDIDEAKIEGVADALAASGMKDAGYSYLIIDDCWQAGRDAHGDIQADPEKFPHGIKALADYIHAKGLKFGIYSDTGIATCQGRPGSRGYEYQDARQYAAWGVDYLKYDWCNVATQEPKSSYMLMKDALQKSGRPIVFSICEWGTQQPWMWGRSVGGNLWRTTGDIWDHWEGRGHNGDWLGVLDILDAEADLSSHAGPGGWNDPDMLEVGNGGMTDAQYRAHFSLWAILAAPLIAGNDVRDMDAATRDILTNKEVINIDQDALGVQGRRIASANGAEVWMRPLADGGRAVVLLNRSSRPQNITANWADLGYPAALNLKVRDLWKHADMGARQGGYSVDVAPQSAVMIRIGA
ncbi:MAG TPA: glycoside hydrolase family 27 protein [Asticcacaulis sp.]|nr:glycoside hydrolase family 27 protein [Asticcacaulis sp.]